MLLFLFPCTLCAIWKYEIEMLLVTQDLYYQALSWHFPHQQLPVLFLLWNMNRFSSLLWNSTISTSDNFESCNQ